jgi:predicted transcriptional regulator of viral defense system
MPMKNYNYLANFVDQLQADGRYSFTLNELRWAFPVSELALKKALNRLVKKGKVTSVRRGFYIIVPPEYSAKATLPPSLFIDDMMKFLNKSYYVGLLSAAAFHGASHQQPQQFFVVIEKSTLRKINHQGNSIKFITRSRIPAVGIENRKTDTGYVRISGPELTAIDLVSSANVVGGISRVASILAELLDVLNIENFAKLTTCKIPITSLQRLGYIFEKVLMNQSIADSLYNSVQKKLLFRIPLKLQSGQTGFLCNNRWKVIVNINIKKES